MLQLGGLSSETKPTDAFVATGSQFFEDDTDAVFTFSGLTWNLEKNGQMKDLPVVTATDNGKVLKVANGVWSVGEDGGGGGGAEKFVVTLTQDEQTEDWTADKTIAEIVAADEANQVVVAKYPENGMYSELPLNMAMGMDGSYAVMFIGLAIAENGNKIIAVQCVNEGSGDNISVQQQYIPTSTNAPLIVTMTAGETEGQFVGDKTYKEVYDAFIAGKTVVVYLAMELEGNRYISAFNVAGVGYSESEGKYHSVVYSTDGAQTLQGSTNDYLTTTMGS
jgi:hypothetical protein